MSQSAATRFRPGIVSGVIWTPLTKHHDARGWLCELFRRDGLPADFSPAMGYASITEAGVTRGPHHHLEQADCFSFFGPGDFQIYLWDIRPSSATMNVTQKELVGASRPMAVIVPPGVVHAYRNVSDVPALSFNFPDRLYKGWERRQPVDEIRHEEQADHPFRMDN